MRSTGVFGDALNYTDSDFMLYSSFITRIQCNFFFFDMELHLHISHSELAEPGERETLLRLSHFPGGIKEARLGTRSRGPRSK